MPVQGTRQIFLFKAFAQELRQCLAQLLQLLGFICHFLYGSAVPSEKVVQAAQSCSHKKAPTISD